MGCELWVVGEGGVANVFCIPRSKYRTPRHELVPLNICVLTLNKRNIRKQMHKNYSAIGPLSIHAPNWFLSPLALHENRTVHVTWRCIDRIAE